MPDSTRTLLIKKLESIILHLENASEGLGYLYNTYYPNYPNQYEPLQSVLLACCQMVELLREFREGM